VPRVRVNLGPSGKFLAVYVGIRRETLTVEQIWLRDDGGLLARGYVHYPAPGRTASGEAITVFGLMQFRRFWPSDVQGIRAYTHELERELKSEVPRVLSPGRKHHASFDLSHAFSSDRSAKYRPAGR
jgi:hypothetical protein